jgi:hypothetical protein
MQHMTVGCKCVQARLGASGRIRTWLPAPPAPACTPALLPQPAPSTAGCTPRRMVTLLSSMAPRPARTGTKYCAHCAHWHKVLGALAQSTARTGTKYCAHWHRYCAHWHRYCAHWHRYCAHWHRYWAHWHRYWAHWHRVLCMGLALRVQAPVAHLEPELDPGVGYAPVEELRVLAVNKGVVEAPDQALCRSCEANSGEESGVAGPLVLQHCTSRGTNAVSGEVS